MSTEPVTITCAPEVKDTPEAIRSSSLFRDWLDRTRAGMPRYYEDTEFIQQVINVRSVHVHAAHRWGKPQADGKPPIQMMYVEADAVDEGGKKLAGLGYLRHDTVETVALLKTEGSDEQWIVLVIQSRVPGGQVVLSLPAGMLDLADTGDFGIAGLRELREETGDDEVKWSKPIDLNHVLIVGLPSIEDWNLGLSQTSGKSLLVSPGGSNERVRIVFTEATVTEDMLARLRRRFGGVQNEGESTQVRVVSLYNTIRHLASVGPAADMKAVLGYYMYKDYMEQNEPKRLETPIHPIYATRNYYFALVELGLQRCAEWARRLYAPLTKHHRR